MCKLFVVNFLLYGFVALLIFAISGIKSENIARCENSIKVENKLRKVIFTCAVGNFTKLSELYDTDYCKYHIFTGALINLWFQLPVCKRVNDIIRDGIADVMGDCPSSASTDNVDVHTLTRVLDKISDRLAGDASLHENYLDVKTAIETEMSAASNKSCKKDFVLASSSKTNQLSRFIIHERFLGQASKQVDAKCDPKGYNRTVLALSIIRVARRPDVRPTVIQMYEDSVFETSKTLFEEMKFLTGGPSNDCSVIVVEDPNVESLLNNLSTRVQKDSTLNEEIELIKKEVSSGLR